jgi:hypothetical protein
MVTYKPVVIFCRVTDLERFLQKKMNYYMGMPPYSRIRAWGKGTKKGKDIPVTGHGGP